MSREPVLVIMAAGMGSRFGGLKQITPVTPQGEIIMDFSLYDAMLAGFKKVIFVIKEEMEEDFRALMDDRAGKYMELCYAFQKTDDLPSGYSVPEGREKPWGTAHAVMAAREYIDGPFAVINADDYYGHEAFTIMYDFLSSEEEKDPLYRFSMVGFRLENTITENGHVARGVCTIDEAGLLETVTERTKIMNVDGKICYEDGDSWIPLNRDDIVSMNFWGFSKEMIEEMVGGFPAFLDDALENDPLKGEYFLPSVADRLIREGKASVKVLSTGDKWYGVTYREDQESVENALQSMKDKGLYPERLWK